MPSVSILAEPTVGLVDGNLAEDGERALAQASLEFPYTPQEQALVFERLYRGWDASLSGPR